MKYQLVLQFDGASIEDFDELIKLEMDLGLSLGSEHVMDGHDFGSSKMNIFIRTNKPEKAFLAAKGTIGKTIMDSMVVAYRAIEGSEYDILHPENYAGEFSLV